MNKIRFIILNCLLFFAVAASATNNDSIFAEYQKRCAADTTIVQIAERFIGTPYVAGTLEGDSVEQLKIRLDAFDCVTFVETALALWRSELKSYDDFAAELQKIRYRNGKIDGFASRLHYTTDWLRNNASMGIVDNITQQLSTRQLPLELNFMTHNRGRYPALRNNFEQFIAIRNIEKSLSHKRDNFFVPKRDVARIDSLIPEGAIIAITTNIEGLDCAHIGLAVKRDGATHLLHASSSQKQVCISQKTLAEYLAANKKFTGIIVAVPKK